MIRKLNIIFLIVLISSQIAKAQNQEYKKFRVGLGLGYAAAGGKGAKGGILVALEPGYRVQDAILLNLRLESAAIVRGTANATNYDLKVAAIGSYTVNGQYYFSNGSFRPYAGLGLGLYSLAAISASGTSSGPNNADLVASATKFGFYPRVGFDAGHFTLNLDFNILPVTKGVDGTEFKNSYVGIRVGGYFGGGRK
jgi:hypothetical protein